MPSRVLIAFVVTLFLPTSVYGTSIIPPRNLGELALESVLVVLAQAQKAEVVDRGDVLDTQTTFVIVEVIGRGDLTGRKPRQPAILASAISEG